MNGTFNRAVQHDVSQVCEKTRKSTPTNRAVSGNPQNHLTSKTVRYAYTLIHTRARTQTHAAYMPLCLYTFTWIVLFVIAVSIRSYTAAVSIFLLIVLEKTPKWQAEREKLDMHRRIQTHAHQSQDNPRTRVKWGEVDWNGLGSTIAPLNTFLSSSSSENVLV